MLTKISLRFSSLSPTTKGICLALVSTALFTIVGVFVRLLSQQYSTFQILFFRQLVFICLLLPAIYRNFELLTHPNKIELHILRISGAFVALYTGYLTVSHLPFADATALGFLQVLFVALISRIFLNENINTQRVVTISVGFIGVMLVVRPSFSDGDIVYVFSGICGALGAAIAVVCVRKVAQTEPKITLLAYQALFVGLLALIPTLWLWQPPNITDTLFLITIGVLSSIAQYVGISAYKWAQANIVANIEYVKILYSLAIGMVIFSEIPDLWAITGAMIIIASAVIPFIWSFRKHNGL